MCIHEHIFKKHFFKSSHGFHGILLGNGSSSSVANQIYAFKSMLGLYKFPVGTFESTKIKVFMNSLQINLNNFPINMSQTTIVDMKILTDIVQICDSMYMGPIFFFF